MVKKISVYSCASILAVSMMASGYAEITGSGFRNTDCSGVIHVNLWMDYDGDGFQDRMEPVFSKADVYVNVTGLESKGIDRFTTDVDGRVQIDSICKGTYTLVIDQDTIPANAVLDAVFEMGSMVIDADLDDQIIVNLSEGSDRLSPGERHLDVAYSPLTRKFK